VACFAGSPDPIPGPDRCQTHTPIRQNSEHTMLKFDPQHCFARGGTEGDNMLQDGVHRGSSKGAQKVLKRCHPAVQRAIKWDHPANLSRAIGEPGGATGRKNVRHTRIAATRSTSRSTQAAAEHRSESGSRGVGSDNCERTTPSARRLRVTQREYSDSLTLDSGRCEHRLHNAVSLLRDLSACIVDEAHFGLSLRLGVHGHS
jgi:hypothetical protein